MEKTNQLRKDHATLFLTFKKPYRNASVQTISRWIEDVLAKSGLDTSIFSTYSTRHASTSLAAAKGVNLDTIIRLAAGWTEGSRTFANFYHRPIVQTCNFANAVLTE